MRPRILPAAACLVATLFVGCETSAPADDGEREVPEWPLRVPSDGGPASSPSGPAPSDGGPAPSLGTLTLTDPAGGAPRDASVGRHGVRILLERDGVPLSGRTVRLTWSRRGAVDARSATVVESPDEAGVYLGTIELPAAGEWTLRIAVVEPAGPRGGAAADRVATTTIQVEG